MKPFLCIAICLATAMTCSGQCLTDFEKILPEPSIDFTQGFGHSVSMYDDFMVVGIPNDDSLGRISGIASIYEKVGEHWKKAGALAPSDPREGLQFGITVKISRDYIFVGSAGYGGKVYVFKKPPAGWTSQTEITSLTVPNAYVFGSMANDPIAISEDQLTLAISDPYHTVQAVPDNYNGAVFVYHRETDEEWNASIVPTMIHSPEPDVLDFGRGGVKIHGDRVAVSAPYTGSGAGAVFIFRDESGSFKTLTHEAKLSSGNYPDTYFFGFKNFLMNDDGIFGSAVMNPSTSRDVSVLFFEKPASGNYSDATPTCTIYAYDDANLNQFITLSGSETGIYTSHLNIDGSGSFTLLTKGPGGWCDAEAEVIDTFLPHPDQVTFAYGSVSASSNLPHCAIGFVPHPESIQAQLSLKIFSRNADDTWTSALLYPTKKSTAGHYFGGDILGFDDYLFVGAPYDGTVRPNGGAVYVYKKAGAEWQKTSKILPPLRGKNDDVFGTAIATNGNQIAIGATGFEEHGRVLIYQRRNNDWTETELVQEIQLPEDILTVFAYGDNLAMNDEWLLIPYIQNAPARIMLALYRFNGTEWEYSQNLEISFGNLFSRFTTMAVDIEDQTIIVGNVIIERNATTGLWEKRYILSPSDPESAKISPDFSHWITNGSMFGHDVDISDNTIFISAPTKDYGSTWDVGAVYVYTKKPWESWSSRTETAKVLPRVKDERELFGYSLKALGNTLIVGAPGSDYYSNGSARNLPGRAYVFQSRDYFWQDVEPLLDFTGDSFVKDYFGMEVNLDATDFLIAAPIEDINNAKLSGSVYVTPAPPIVKLVPPVCNDVVIDLLGYPFGGVWSGPGIIDAAEGIFDPKIAGLGEHEFTYETPSCTYLGRLKITVEAPVEARLSGPTLHWVCQNTSIQVLLSVTEEPNHNYLWYYRQSTSEPFFPVNNQQATMNATKRGEYMVKMYNPACQSFSPVITIKDENVDLSLTPVEDICQDQPGGVALTATPSGGSWSGTGVSGNAFNPKGLPDATYTLTYKYTSTNTCLYQKNIPVVIERLPAPVIKRSSGNLCVEGQVNIVASSGYDPANFYTWEAKPDNADFVALNEHEPTLETTERGAFQLKADNGRCISRSNIITIDDSTFKIYMTPDDAEINFCNGDETMLSIRHSETQSYQWFYRETEGSTPELISDNQTYSLAAKASGYYFAEVHSGLCAVTSPEKHIVVAPADSIFVPNFFSPNGDGFNDVFHIHTSQGNVPFHITNRHGKEVFSGSSESGWTGEGAASGIYFWYVSYQTCEEQRRVYKGAVHLMR